MATPAPSQSHGGSKHLALLAELRSIESIHDEYTFDSTFDRIGAGAFSIVYKAARNQQYQDVTSRPSSRDGQHSVALKVIPKKRLETEKHAKDVLREARLLGLMDCKHCPKLVEAVQTRSDVILVMTLVEGVELGKVLRKTGALPEKVVGVLTAQVLSTLQFLHSMDCVHRDLKPDNLLLSIPSERVERSPGEVGNSTSGEANHNKSEGFSSLTSAEESPQSPQRSQNSSAPPSRVLCDVDDFTVDSLTAAVSQNLHHITLVDFGFARGVSLCENKFGGLVNSCEDLSSLVDKHIPSNFGGTGSSPNTPNTAMRSSFEEQTTRALLRQRTTHDGSQKKLKDSEGAEGCQSTPVSSNHNYSDSSDEGAVPTTTNNLLVPEHNASARNSPEDSNQALLSPHEPALFSDTVFLSTCGAERFIAPELLKVILEDAPLVGGASALPGRSLKPKHVRTTSEGNSGKKRTTTELAKKVDLYSLGVLCFVLLSGCFPFNAKTKSSLLAQTINGVKFTSSSWSNVSPDAKSFVSELLCLDPEKRLSAAQALDHPWVRQNNKTTSE